MTYINENIKTYEKAYENGWGNHYIDSMWVSLYHGKVKGLLKRENSSMRVLDFGCSLGANSKFFADLGFEVYGIDISKEAIRRCVTENNFKKENFVAVDIINQNKEIRDIFGGGVTFDIVFAGEVLYYFNETDLKEVLRQFYEAMNEEGIFCASMVTFKNAKYNEYRDAPRVDGLIKIEKNNTIEEALYANLINDYEDLKSLFSIFECYGTYRCILEIDVENEDLYYIGRKGMSKGE